MERDMTWLGLVCCVLPSGLLEEEALATYRRLKHQTLPRQAKYGDPVTVVRVSRHTFPNRYRRCLRREFEVAAFEALERLFVPEKDHLTVGLTTKLKTDATLGYTGVPGHYASFEDLAFAIGTAETEGTALDNRWKHRVAICFGEKLVQTRILFLKSLNGVLHLLILVWIPSRLHREHGLSCEGKNNKNKNCGCFHFAS